MARRSVTILLTNQMSPFEFSCAMELFALPREERGGDWYESKVISLTSSRYPSVAGISIHCELKKRIPSSDLLVIPSYSVHAHESVPRLGEAVMRHHDRGGRTIAFCSGAFLLAEAGLLDGRVATTHWMYAEYFRRRFPNIELAEDRIYAYDGVVGCSAGSAAAIDLGIEVIRRDYGYEAANAVARRLVLPAHRSGGQAQFIEKPLAYEPSAISKVMDWAVVNLSNNISVGDMACKANMSRRNFDRHFKRTHRITPGVWLGHRKLEVARKLLETTDGALEEIALRSGYDNAITLRKAFKKVYALSPTEYRHQFRA